MVEANRKLLGQVEQIEREQLLASPPEPVMPIERATIHFTELPEDSSGGPLAQEWNAYRHEVARLIAEGHEGRWVLIRGESVVGVWDTDAEARTAAVESFWMQPVLIHQVQVRESVLRSPSFLSRCRN